MKTAALAPPQVVDTALTSYHATESAVSAAEVPLTKLSYGYCAARLLRCFCSCMGLTSELIGLRAKNFKEAYQPRSRGSD